MANHHRCLEWQVTPILIKMVTVDNDKEQRMKH